MKARALKLFFAFLVAWSVLSCHALKQAVTKPPAEGISQNSYSEQISGYEQSVSIKAPLKTVTDYLADSRNWFIFSGMAIDERRKARSAVPIGDSFPLTIKKMGLEISGLMILIKSDENKLWYVWDNPTLLQIQRWDFAETKEGTRLTLKVETENPQKLAAMVDLVEQAGVLRQVYEQMDRTLADIQANFDPSLNPEELVSRGLRGEEFQTLVQIHEGTIWINAQPEKVVTWMFDNQSSMEFLPGLKIVSENVQLREIPQMGPDQVKYMLCEYELGNLKIPMDSFVTRRVDKDSHIYNFYMTALGSVFRIRLQCAPEAAGTRLTVQILTEIPQGLTPATMDLALSLMNMPERLNKALMTIKERMEASG